MRCMPCPRRRLLHCANAAHLAQPQRVQIHLMRYIICDIELHCAAAAADGATVPVRAAPRQAAAEVRRHRPHEQSPEAGRHAHVLQVARDPVHDVDPPRESVQFERRRCRVEGPGREPRGSVVHRVQRVAELRDGRQGSVVVQTRTNTKTK